MLTVVREKKREKEIAESQSRIRTSGRVFSCSFSSRRLSRISMNDSVHDQGEDFVQWVHGSSLDPFRNGGSGLRKSQPLKDIIHSIGFNVFPCPGK